MKLYCYKCDKEVDAMVVRAGPHAKGMCPARHYLKMLNRRELQQIEEEKNNMSPLTKALDTLDSITEDRTVIFGMKRVENTVDEARDKFNTAMEEIRNERADRRGSRQKIWTCCGVTRPIEQRCSCGERYDD